MKDDVCPKCGGCVYDVINGQLRGGSRLLGCWKYSSHGTWETPTNKKLNSVRAKI